MVYAVLIGLMLTLDLPFIQSQYSHVRGQLTPNKDTLIVRDTLNNYEIVRLPMRREWTGGIVYPGVFLAKTDDAKVHLSVYGGQTLTFNDTVTAAKILTNDRYLILGERYGVWTLVDERGQVLRQTRFSDVALLPHHRGLFTARAGWAEDGEELYELWSASGTKAYDGVFHQMTEYYNDNVSKDSMFCLRGGLLTVIDKSGAEISRRTLYRTGEPSRENGFVGRWTWSYAHYDQDSVPLPAWVVPYDSVRADVPFDGRMTIRLDTVTSRLFAEKIKAATIIVKNISTAPVRLSDYDRQFPVEYRVEREDGSWNSVCEDRMLYRGYSRGFRDVASGDSILIPIPQFVGSTRTRFRVAIQYYDTDNQRSEASITWEGSFNFDTSAMRFRRGLYGDLEQIVGAGFVVGDVYQDPTLKAPLNILPLERGREEEQARERKHVIPTDRNGDYVPINARIKLTRDTTKPLLFENVAKGFRLVIHNQSNGPLQLESIEYEVKIGDSSWRSVYQPDRKAMYCGTDVDRERVIYSYPRSYNLEPFGVHREAISDVWDGSINTTFDPKYPKGRY